MIAPPPRLVCSGCGVEAGLDDPRPFACIARRDGDDIDHVLVPVHASTPEIDDDPNPFVRYRRTFHAWRVAQARGMSDERFVALVRELDARVAAVDGAGFTITPYSRAQELSRVMQLPGGIFIKDETGNVAGSHKARHLFGLALFLSVAEETGLAVYRDEELVIASCGNAALAAAVIARAVERPLRVFVPTDADASVLARLSELGAEIEECPRRASDPPGDPCLRRLRAALATGALPFTCQGSENGLCIEGGETLGREIAEQHAATGAPPLAHLFVQVGGGALATAVALGLRTGCEEPPCLHPVQVEGCHPLERAWRRVGKWMESEQTELEPALHHAATHRSEFMTPWEREPRSVATGILDDETYDWLAVVRATFETHGWPIVAPEELFEPIGALGTNLTGIDVCATGMAGLVGLAAALDDKAIDRDQPVAVIFTGQRR